jgi:integrase
MGCRSASAPGPLLRASKRSPGSSITLTRRAIDISGRLPKRKEADAFQATAKVEIRQGTHTADRDSITVEEAAKLWLKTGEGNELERSTLSEYADGIRLHIVPFIGRMKMSHLSGPVVRRFEDDLREAGRSSISVRRVRGFLSMLIADAMERGYVNRNVVRDLKCGKERKAE